MHLQPGVGYTFSGTGAAATLVIDEAWVYAERTHPSQVFCTKVGSDYIVRVIPGTINNIEPTISGTQLSAVPPPTLNIGFSASPQTVYIYLQMPVGA